MKILAVYNETGGDFHRVWLPLAHHPDHEVKLEETITENVLEEFKPDILYIHWNSPVSIPQLSIWQSKYRFKVIADIDDTWKGLSKKYERTIFQSQNLCLFADAVICTNKFIEEQVREFNDNTIIIPNYLPDNYGGGFERKIGDKVRIGIYGSIKGHYQNWLSLKPLIKKLTKDKNIKDKVHFVLAGIDENPKWMNIYKLFPKDNTSLLWHEEPENSINLMKNIDILLCPLGNDDISKGRSNLKVYEACSVGTIPVISSEYLSKDSLNGFFPIFDNLNGCYDIIRNLVNSEKVYNHYLHQTYIMNQRHNYQIECVDTRINLFNRVLSDNTQSKEVAEIYSITYSPEQTGEYRPFFNPIKTIKHKSYLFEYNPIVFLSDFTKTKGYFGVFSHKFPMKTGFYKKIVFKILENETADVVSFCKPIKNYLMWSEYQHPGLLKILEFICNKLNLKYKEPKHTIYSNFFVAKGDIYKEYVNTVVKPAIKLMEEDSWLKERVWKDANYKSGLNSEQLKQQTELDYYPFHTFVLERLFSIWLETNNHISVNTYT